jgi:hypothetical protein
LKLNSTLPTAENLIFPPAGAGELNVTLLSASELKTARLLALIMLNGVEGEMKTLSQCHVLKVCKDWFMSSLLGL